uniref:F-box domain-containing protein n=1 Tax=Syphacia muris TaxID=451379 RepID=A0A158R500_9BILA
MICGWDQLPSELLLMIMSYMDAKDLFRLGKVNYHWRRVSEDNCLWKRLFIRDYEVPKATRLKIGKSWVEEYKILNFNSPLKLYESFRDCPLGVVHVSFSPNGELFCTTAADGSFKVWTATSPTYLIHERYLQDTLGWQQALFSQFGPDSKRLLICGLKSESRGEVAIFFIDENYEVHSVCRAPNNPYDFSCCWYDTTHILTSDVYLFSRNSVIGSSATQIFLCSALSPCDHANESFLCPILRLLNRQGGVYRLIALSRYVPARLRGVVILAREARAENKTLSAKAKELTQNMSENATEDEVRDELKRKVEELSGPAERSCVLCAGSHEIFVSEQEQKQLPYPCLCLCHDKDDRLLIHAYGETDTALPRAVAFKVISGVMVSLVSKQQCASSRESSSRESQHHADNIEDQLSSIMSLFDLPDYVIDMEANVTGLTLSADHRFLFVNVVHDRFDHNRAFIGVAEIRCINLQTLSLEQSYFGHFSRFKDRFSCAVGDCFLASPSLGGVRVWSKQHKCVIGKLQETNEDCSVAIQPNSGEMLVTVNRADGRVKIWKSRSSIYKPTFKNDFM